MKSTATTVDEYLAGLPPERRETLERVREVIVRNLPEGYSESMSFGMISYGIPLERYPNTYNRQPLAYAALAAQKNYNALYLMSVYQDNESEQQLRSAFDQAGLKLDIGKSCIRFKRAEELPLPAIGELIAATPPEAHIAAYEAARKK